MRRSFVIFSEHIIFLWIFQIIFIYVRQLCTLLKAQASVAPLYYFLKSLIFITVTPVDSFPAGTDQFNRAFFGNLPFFI